MCAIEFFVGNCHSSRGECHSSRPRPSTADAVQKEMNCVQKSGQLSLEITEYSLDAESYADDSARCAPKTPADGTVVQPLSVAVIVTGIGPVGKGLSVMAVAAEVQELWRPAF